MSPQDNGFKPSLLSRIPYAQAPGKRCNSVGWLAQAVVFCLQSPPGEYNMQEGCESPALVMTGDILGIGTISGHQALAMGVRTPL